MDQPALMGIFPIMIEDNVCSVFFNAQIVLNPLQIVENVQKIG